MTHTLHYYSEPQEEAATMRGLKTSTIVGHMARCIQAGLPVDIARLGLTDRMQAMITDVIRRPPINSGTRLVMMLQFYAKPCSV